MVEYFGFEKIEISVDDEGLTNMEELKEVVEKQHEQIAMISIMLANNEIGSIQPISDIKKLLAKYDKNGNIFFHTDASQACGKINVDVKALGVDFLSLAGHKLYAPKGIGALYIKKGRQTHIESLIHGASHEKGIRAGTENAVLALALGKAADIFAKNASEDVSHSRKLRNLLRNDIISRCKIENIEVKVNGPSDEAKVLPNTLSISFKDVNSRAVLQNLQKYIACSVGSACHTSKKDYSFVLKAVNLDAQFAIGTFRLSVGRFTTGDDVKRCSDLLVDAIKQYLFVTYLPKTKKLYFLDTHLFQATTNVLVISDVSKEVKDKFQLTDEAYLDIVLDQTIFHPQGGGQPNDEGTMNQKKVVALYQENGIVHHVINKKESLAFVVNGTVNLQVNASLRKLHAKLHSAGHLIDLAVAQCEPLKHLVASKGCHFVEKSYVEYKGKIDNTQREELAKEIQSKVDQLLSTSDGFETKVLFKPKDKVTTMSSISLNDWNFNDESKTSLGSSQDLLDESKVRIVFIGSSDNGCLCGGTHVKNISEIGKIIIEKIQYKKKVTKVTYKVQ